MNIGSVGAFLEGLFDYAGLFPPASLPLAESVRRYAAYQRSDDAWMLGRFVVPAARLNELEPHLSLFSEDHPLSCAALGRKSEDEAECLAGLRADLTQIQDFCERYADIADIGVLELPLPSAAPPANGLLEAIAAEVQRQGMELFCEAAYPFSPDWRRQMTVALDAIAAYNASEGKIMTIGLKFRTGGLHAAAFPSPAELAFVLAGCRDRRIPLKFTAGLHHPIRMYRSEVETRMHGFVNVFTAGMLAHERNAGEELIEQILADEDSASFSFTADGLAWRDLSLSAPAIARLRGALLRSYGTCSFDEPRDDLRALHIL
ncbi:hypothetical protein [Brevibacillus massiliensis]|uniref:hypothetical protein n=1 Tax=Brevibacillus massiliensis TaxID=1118054 RepID=UPI000304A38B|nr:hypothetical protein [Brevibacillus massiliensis]